jgi:DnaB-like helicase C terminal domain
LPIYVDARSSLKIQELLATARLYVRRHQVQLVVVDYLRSVDAPGRDLGDRVGNVANALRQLAKSERIGVVLLSQLRRPDGGINGKPSMLDLKESGDIEAHSHVVLLPCLPVGEDGRPIPDEVSNHRQEPKRRTWFTARVLRPETAAVCGTGPVRPGTYQYPRSIIRTACIRESRTKDL